MRVRALIMKFFERETAVFAVANGGLAGFGAGNGRNKKCSEDNFGRVVEGWRDGDTKISSTF
jgi:hypothetical protein